MSKKMKRAFVSLPDGAWDIINNDLKGQLGDGDSEIIRNIVIAYLSDKGYFVNEKTFTSYVELNDKLVVMEEMMTTIISVLEEKRLITPREFEDRMRRQIAKLTHKSNQEK